jgi:hypothetical protein
VPARAVARSVSGPKPVSACGRRVWPGTTRRQRRRPGPWRCNVGRNHRCNADADGHYAFDVPARSAASSSMAVRTRSASWSAPVTSPSR